MIRIILLLSFLFLFFQFDAIGQKWAPKNGAPQTEQQYTVLINGHIYLGNGEWLTNGKILLKGNKIKAVGNEIALPDYTLVHDLQGKFVYPSFIDLHTSFGIDKPKPKSKTGKPQLESTKEGPYYWNESVRPEVEALDYFSYDQKTAESYREQGFGTVLTHFPDGVIRGTSALIALTHKQEDQLIKNKASMHYSFFKGSSRQTYPSSLMGIIALIRQFHYDAEAYEQQAAQLPYNRSLEAVNQMAGLPKIIAVDSYLSALRADKIADEFGFQFMIKGDGQEYKRMKAVKAMNTPLIVPLNFPKPYDVSDPYDALQLPLSKMKEWELADENAVRLMQEEIQFAFTTADLEKRADFLGNLKRCLQKGLSHDHAIAALTSVPAKLIGMEQTIGKLAENYSANFIIATDTLFEKNSRILANWVAGKEYRLINEAKIDLRGTYSLNVNKRTQFDLKIEGSLEKPKAEISAKGDNNYSKAKLKLEGNRVNLWYEKGNQSFRLSGVVNDSLGRIWTGKTIVNENWVDWAAIRKSYFTEKPKDTIEQGIKSKALASLTYPLMAYGWDSLPQEAETILFRKATLWTNEEEGILKDHDLLIHNGKIKMVGYKINLQVMFPDLVGKVREIDASGLHITSGIVDEHSHIAISRGVNESGQSITSEVSIGDVVNSDDINLYRQLAGGVTASQLLHGSANPIGGQSALIKLRWGQEPEKMKIADAPGFIKFALGENVKQSNWGDERTVRFPQSRMGVEQVFYDGFTRARAYRDEWLLYNAKSKREKKKISPPRTDLELKALVEILDTQRFVTCHSYIQSEINMLMHVADSMKFRINTFTHVLEGYKVANKLRQHGAAASTFSDWWAYKFEVNDAIPYNGAMLHEQEVLTGFNSDDAEMGRRLNQEAAKAMKYGGLSAEEAWKLVTLNPAKMLHLDHRMGSLAPGKDADLVVWNDFPLSIYAKPLKTYIDGIAYFDAERDHELRANVIRERERLIKLMLQAKEGGEQTQKVKKEKQKLYECNTLEP